MGGDVSLLGPLAVVSLSHAMLCSDALCGRWQGDGLSEAFKNIGKSATNSQWEVKGNTLFEEGAGSGRPDQAQINSWAGFGDANLAATFEAELAEARQAMLDGRGLEAEMQRQMEERLEREKQKRIEHTQEMALKRIGKRDLTRGWTAWHDEWAERTRRTRTAPRHSSRACTTTRTRSRVPTAPTSGSPRECASTGFGKRAASSRGRLTAWRMSTTPFAQSTAANRAGWT